MNYKPISQLLGLILFFLGSQARSLDCASPYRRKEIRELSSSELKTYADAVKKLHNTLYNLKISIHESYTKLHEKYQGRIHQGPFFLPWHRYFLREYEKELQKINPSVYLPFWDWSKDYEFPHKSPVLSNKMFGSNGVGSGLKVKDGLFANMAFKYPSSHSLQRNYDLGKSISPFASVDSLVPSLNEKKFSFFSAKLEGPHGSPHIGIGLDCDFGSMTSPNDPLFYLHHAFIDLLWNEWQIRNPNTTVYEGEAFETDFSLSDNLDNWNATVKDTINLNSAAFCYTYPRYPIIPGNLANLLVKRSDIPTYFSNSSIPVTVNLASINPIVFKGKEELSNLTTTKLISKLKNGYKVKGRKLKFKKKKIAKRVPLPDAWIEMNGLNKTRIRANEKKDAELIDLLNADPNFIPFEVIVNSNTTNITNTH